LKDDEGRGKLR